ncbi:FxsA family protein [Methylobrevis albus]|uniref:Membrane protein FxsA n=1 Tax=Methylobrevis albus TaxID=2793297 RepID=A0A931I1V0_9HYPH|nr:FxsA family protein [Methylobrevis albus]MBH0237721.1 membrane protein FxsA [Methylobrevis albus]
MRIGPIIALLLLALPFAEIAAFIMVGREVGVLATIGLVLLTAVAGALMLRLQGLALIRRIRAETAAGRVPGSEIVEGALLVVAGFLLLIPGFVTDVVGVLLFIPAVRRRLARSVVGSMSVTVVGSGFARGQRPRSGVVDLDPDEYRRETPDEGPGAPGQGRLPPGRGDTSPWTPGG